MVDSASPLTFINWLTWKGLNEAKLMKTNQVLGAFEGQSIKPLEYYIVKVR